MSFSERISQSAKLGLQKGLEVLLNADELFPSPMEIVEMKKEILMGTPVRFVLDALDKFCSLALRNDENMSRGDDIIPIKENLNIIFYNDKDNASYPLEDIESIVNHSEFDKEAPVVILITGWLSNQKEKGNEVTETMYGAYKCRGSTNFLVMDNDKYVTSLYAWSSVNAEDLGKHLGPAIEKLSKHINLTNIHLIGHSLGAQIAGAAGRYFTNSTNKKLHRITGFDPARPCFNEGEYLTSIGRGDGDFVDIIHSNSGGLGKTEPIGDADFYPNGVKLYMPGCYTMFRSHSMAWRYYAESVYPGNEYGFMATKCNSYESYKNNQCQMEPIPMGYATPLTARGVYFLQTNAEAPYGKNSTTANKCISL